MKNVSINLYGVNKRATEETLEFPGFPGRNSVSKVLISKCYGLSSSAFSASDFLDNAVSQALFRIEKGKMTEEQVLRFSAALSDIDSAGSSNCIRVDL